MKDRSIALIIHHARFLKPRFARIVMSLSLMLVLLAAVSSQPATDAVQETSVRSSNLHRWGAVTLFHGLPSDRVRAIAQDADGVMWFGTDAGLAKYDGRRTQTVPGEQLAARRVLALRFDAEGALWIGTDAGALRLREGKFEEIAETKSRAVTAIAVAPGGGRVLLVTNTGTLVDCRTRPDGALDVKTISDRLLQGAAATTGRTAPLELTSIALVDAAIYVGTRGRGLVMLRNGGAAEVVSRPRAFFVEALEADAQGRLWFGARTTAEDSGLFMSEETGATELVPSKIMDGSTGAVSALRLDAGGDLWVGTDGQGVARYRGSQRLEHFTFEGTAGGLRSNRIHTIFTDREGVAWFGTDRGVCRYDPHGFRNETLSTDAQSNFVRALFRTSGGKLLAGTNRGLFVFENGAWLAVEGMDGKSVYTVAEDAGGRLLVGTASGLYAGADLAALENVTHESAPAAEDKPETGTTTPVEKPQPNRTEATEATTSGSVRAVAFFRGATYLASFGRGVERLNESSGRTLVWPLDPSDARAREVVSLHADGDERLWIGTANTGVFFFDGQTVQTDPALKSLGRSAVWSINGTSAAALWFATADGLYVHHAGALTEAVPDVDARSVVASVEDGAPPQAWCATAGRGLLRVRLDPQFGPIRARLDAEQGLASQNAFALLSLRDAGGGAESLLIGTSRGVARYEPGRLPPVLRVARVAASRPFTHEEVRRGVELDYPQNSLALDVAATSSRTFPEQFQYAFLLLDAKGEIIGRRFGREAQFQVEELAPGAYRVVARAFSSELVPSETLAFGVTVARAPFPWTSAALSVLLMLALVALFWGAAQNRRMARTSLALAHVNRQLAVTRLQLANETEAERRRIARDLHDQTLADLRRLMLLTDEMPAEQPATTTGVNGQHAQRFPSVMRAEIESISKEIRRICEDLSPSVLENVGFAAALEWALVERVAHLPAGCRFAYDFECADDLDERLHFSPGVQMQIYRIVQEAISNVCRHAAATHVRLRVSLDEGKDFLLELEDDGRGFDHHDKRAHTGRGLANIRARASIIEAEVSWTPVEEGGTRFVLRKSLS